MCLHHQCKSQTVFYSINLFQMLPAESHFVCFGTDIVFHVTWSHRIFYRIIFQFLIHCAEWTLTVFVKCIINGNRIYLFFHFYTPFYVYCLHNRQGRRHSLRQPLLNSLIVSYCMHKCYLHFLSNSGLKA